MRRTGGPLAKRDRQTRAHLDVAWLIVLPSAQHERLPRRAQFTHHHRRRHRLAKRGQRLPRHLEFLLLDRLFFQLGDLGAVPIHLLPLRRAGQFHERLVRQLVRVADVRRLRHVVEQRVKLVKLLLRNRVVFVVVTSRTAEGQAEEHRRGGLHAIHHRLDPVLLVDDAALALNGVVAVEAGGHLLIDCRVRQQIAGDLLHGEPVERHVVVERANHPVTPRPHHAATVKAVPVRVGVPRGVEPVERHPFAIARRRQQPVDDILERTRRRVCKEGIDLPRRRRQAGEVERDSAKECLPVRPRRRVQPGPLQLGQDETVNRTAWPGGVFCRGNCWALGRDEGPVLSPFAALLNPRAECLDVARGQRPAGVDRRHPLLRIGVGDALEQLALGWLAGDDHRLAKCAGVQPEVGFALGRIRPVTPETVLRKNRPDIAVEPHRLPRNHRVGQEPPGKQQHAQK